jgi:AhpD family alkylhydroperoxidase
MSRIPLDHPRTPVMRLAEAYSRRKYGQVLQPGLAILHNRRVLTTMLAHENKVARWRSLDQTTKALAVLAAAAEIGCSWCVDFGFWESANRGVDPAKLRAIGDWQSAEVYTDDERAVIAYAIAMTRTPMEVTDEMVADLRTRFSDEQLVELTAMISLENSRSRTNAAFGLTSQGFQEFCDLPEAVSETMGS